jgi:hypothetical protein
LDGGKRMVSIISADNLFRHSAIKEALMTADSLQADSRALTSLPHDEQERVLDDDEQVVVFRLDKEEFGVPIDSVQEIVRVPEQLTHVPKAPSFVEGCHQSARRVAAGHRSAPPLGPAGGGTFRSPAGHGLSDRMACGPALLSIWWPKC